MRPSRFTAFRRRAAGWIVSLLALSSIPAGALAATSTSNLVVSALVNNNCLISTSPVAFGVYDPTGVNAASDRSATGSVTVTCTLGASVTVTLGQGAQAVGAVDAEPVRQMAAGANRLGYFLYQNAGATTVWGNTSGTGVAVTGDGLAQILTVYGVVPAGRNVPSGVYGDVVVATVTF